MPAECRAAFERTFEEGAVDRRCYIGRKPIRRFAVGDIEHHDQRVIALQFLLQRGKAKGKAGGAVPGDFAGKAHTRLGKRVDAPSVHNAKLGAEFPKEWLTARKP